MTNPYDCNELYSYNSDPDDLGHFTKIEHLKRAYQRHSVAKETENTAKNSVTFKTRDNYSNDIQQRNPFLVQQIAMWFMTSLRKE